MIFSLFYEAISIQLLAGIKFHIELILTRKCLKMKRIYQKFGIFCSAEVDINHRHAQLVINYAGNVSWYTHSMWKSSCSIDVTNFPFDDQTCSLLFGSWTHSSQELNLDFAIPVSSVVPGWKYKTSINNHLRPLRIRNTHTNIPRDQEKRKFTIVFFSGRNWFVNIWRLQKFMCLGDYKCHIKKRGNFCKLL